MTSPGWAAPSYDVLVIGAGLAGLSAAAKLAEGGAKVMLIAKGVGATHLGPGTIDVLGYAPDRVERPGEALAGLGGETIASAGDATGLSVLLATPSHVSAAELKAVFAKTGSPLAGLAEIGSHAERFRVK